jgi:hypothetical protein
MSAWFEVMTATDCVAHDIFFVENLVSVAKTPW